MPYCHHFNGLLLKLIAPSAEDGLLWRDQSKPVPETYATSSYHSHGAPTLFEDTANLI